MTVENDAGDRGVTRAMTLVVVVVVRTVVDRHQEADATNVDEPAMIGIALVLVLVVARARARARARREIHRRAQKPHHRLRHTAIVVVNQRIKKETTTLLSIDTGPPVEEDATGH
jgi:uncharacterized membrane protein